MWSRFLTRCCSLDVIDMFSTWSAGGGTGRLVCGVGFPRFESGSCRRVAIFGFVLELSSGTFDTRFAVGRIGLTD